MYFGKWWTLSAAAALEFVAGLNATYGLYALAVRDTFDYTQSQVQGIGTALITAGFLAIVPGIIFDRLHHHHKLGPRCGYQLMCRFLDKACPDVCPFLIMMEPKEATSAHMILGK